MGILDQLLGAALGGQLGAAGQTPQAQDAQGQGAPGQVSQMQVTDMAQAVMSMLNDPRIGGINGLMQKFQSGGLGEVFQSWVGTGQNRGISNDQLDQILGQQKVEQIAQGAGLPSGQGASILTQLLPLMIDGLTPKGQVPDQDQLSQNPSDLLKRLLG